ncbi:T9SS type A sorting domain-containing protein [Sphingobacterium sp. lm-10]|uniref:T9SS type A sorting domain-containing protein n=1 Tax=Sphingobacterium sp. lm-10 TaxID=2944904 RepID=UPI002021E676|nr:T9SS type A sorting domain-containing protein [Sphingobacterium sp. lm-10]MCL7988886.1 T9SS type A sorting domain-containing protein [Sphingobacterium sp. lm-10]
MRKHLQYVRTWLYISVVALVVSANVSYAAEAHLLFKVDTASISSLSTNQLASIASRTRRDPGSLVDVNNKVITNVKVFYNPVAEQVAVSFKLSKLSSVSIRVMDALGNEVMGLMNGDLDGGIQSLNFDTSSKLPAGFYFVRVTSGSETVIKRISIR